MRRALTAIAVRVMRVTLVNRMMTEKGRKSEWLWLIRKMVEKRLKAVRYYTVIRKVFKRESLRRDNHAQGPRNSCRYISILLLR